MNATQDVTLIEQQPAPDPQQPDPLPGISDSQDSAQAQTITNQEVDQKPWKYIGYRGYSEFLASETDYLVFRRFASISARVALMLQHQQYSRREAVDVNSGSFRNDEDDRKELLEQLRVKLLQYNEFLLQQSAIKNHPKPTPQDIKSLQTWHCNHHNQAIAASEHSYLHHKLDLLSLVSRDKTPLRKFLERFPSFMHSGFWHSRKTRDLPIYDKGNITYISDKRLDRFATAVIVIVGLFMLITPLWILQALSGKTFSQLGIITAFVVLFLGMVSYATVAKPFETLGATAAYAAVLTVFLQSGGN